MVNSYCKNNKYFIVWIKFFVVIYLFSQVSDFLSQICLWHKVTAAFKKGFDDCQDKSADKEKDEEEPEIEKTEDRASEPDEVGVTRFL